MPSRVGTLDACGLAVYERADGSIYYNQGGKRCPVHGNTRWTASTTNVRMRGRNATSDVAEERSEDSDSVESDSESDSVESDSPAFANREQDELELAIAASLQDTAASAGEHAAPPQGPSCVVCLTASVDHMIRSCNHACVCATCATRLDACPICREPIASVERIWLS